MPAPETPNGIVPYISPILQRLKEGHPDPLPACASCPASMWYASDQLKCFCSRMHVLTWESGTEPIQVCDGRELAVLAILEAQAEKAERKADRKLAWKEAAEQVVREREATSAAAANTEAAPEPLPD